MKPPLPLDRLVLADSEVSRVSVQDGGLTLHFSAASVWREGQDLPRLAGHLAPVSLQLFGPPPPQALGDCQGRLAEGRLLLEGRALPALQLPSDLSGELTLQLRFAQGPEWQMQAHRVLTQAAPGARFTESLAC